MLDDAMGITASISQRFALMVPTLQMSVSYLEPTPMARVIAHGQVLRMGATSNDGPPRRPLAATGRHPARHGYRKNISTG